LLQVKEKGKERDARCLCTTKGRKRVGSEGRNVPILSIIRARKSPENNWRPERKGGG